MLGHAMHCLMDDVELGWSEILTLEDLLLRDWLGSTECISSLGYADGSQQLSFGYPKPARKQLS